MEEENLNQKEIQTSFQAIQSEIVVAESELQVKEGVRRIIKKYQDRIAEMLKLIQRQKRQHDGLKLEVKKLNEQMNSVLKRIQQRPKQQQQQKGGDARYQLTKKQLENEIKKNAIMRKQLQQLRQKVKFMDGEKIDELKNEIKDKERIIEELNAQIKLEEKMKKQEKSGDSYKKQEELSAKILQQNQEIVHLKKKVQEQKKKQEELEKNIKILREQVMNLEGKISSRTSLQKPKQKIEDKELEPQIQKLREKYRQLENAKKMNDKSSRSEIEVLNNKLRSVERELAEVKQLVARKDKESNIMLYRLKEKERKNFNTLEPIKTARYSEEVLHSSGGLFQTRKSFKGLNWGQGVYRQFDDSSKLPIEKNYRIKRLVFTYFQEHVLSLTTDYDILQGEYGKDLTRQTKTIESFAIPTQFANIQICQHLFGDYEYIVEMELYCGKGIEFIRIMTSKEHILEVGNSKSLPKCKKESFEIGSHQKPIAFMGVIESRKMGSEHRELLVNFGLQMRRKQVFIRGKNRRLQSSLNRSILAKGGNDKNIKKD